MKISEMSFKDRFDDLIEKITGIHEDLEEDISATESDLDLRPELQELESLGRRLTKLRDDILAEKKG